MNVTKTLVVSNHANHDLEWLKMTYKYGFSPENTIIYDRTPDNFVDISVDASSNTTVTKRKNKIDHLGKVIRSPNVGSNIFDIGRYIVDHYDNLPDVMIHIKGNLLYKGYTTFERFIYGLNANWLVPLDRGINIGIDEIDHPFLLNDNFFCHPMTLYDEPQYLFGGHNVIRMKFYDRFPRLREFIHDLFVVKDDCIPKYISFAPAANYVVPKNCILKYSKNFYKKMMYYTDYNENPIESHWYERVLLMAWQGCLEENMSFIVPDSYEIPDVNYKSDGSFYRVGI